MNPNKKIDLAGGGYCLYSPRFPRFVDSLGFADEVLISNAPVSLLYALAIVEKGRPRALTLEKIEQAQGKAEKGSRCAPRRARQRRRCATG